MGLFNRRPHGCWIEIEHRNGSTGYECSNCGREFDRPHQLCYCCGATMDLGIIDEAEAFEAFEILMDDDDDY